MTQKEMYEPLQAACNGLTAALQNKAPAATLRQQLSDASSVYVRTMMEIDNELQRMIDEGQ